MSREKTKWSKGIAFGIFLTSAIAGFINGLWVIFAGASYLRALSPYAYLTELFPLSIRIYILQIFEYPAVLFLAPLSGAAIGVLIGKLIPRIFKHKPHRAYIIIGIISGGVTGLLSLGIIFFWNIYAT